MRYDVRHLVDRRRMEEYGFTVRDALRVAYVLRSQMDENVFVMRVKGHWYGVLTPTQTIKAIGWERYRPVTVLDGPDTRFIVSPLWRTAADAPTVLKGSDIALMPMNCLVKSGLVDEAKKRSFLLGPWAQEFVRNLSWYLPMVSVKSDLWEATRSTEDPIDRLRLVLTNEMWGRAFETVLSASKRPNDAETNIALSRVWHEMTALCEPPAELRKLLDGTRHEQEKSESEMNSR